MAANHDTDGNRNPLIDPGSPAETADRIARVALFLASAGHPSDSDELDDGRDLVITCIQEAARYLAAELGTRHV